MRRAAPAAFAAALLLQIATLEPTVASAQARGEYLEPEDGAFTFGLGSYHIAVSEALFGNDRFRLCQMVFLPSFEREGAVYILKNETPTSATVVVAVEAEEQIWAQMKYLETHLGGSLSQVDQQRALARIPKRVRRVSRALDVETGLLLQAVWEAMLARVQYQGERTLGFDGESYHAAHPSRERGYMAGKVWSPTQGTAASDFVSLAQTLRAYAADDATHGVVKHRLTLQARQLLARLGLPHKK